MALHHAFERTARRLPDKVAVVGGDEQVTYGSLLGRVQALADALCDDGVGRGDRVLVMLENSIEYAVAVHAVLAAGAVFVPVSPLVKADKLGFLADDTRACALIADARQGAVWEPVLGRSATLRSCRVAGLAAGAASSDRVAAWPPPAAARRHPEPAPDDDDLAMIIYTSGTTGVPKGVMLTHAGIAAAWAAVQAYLGLREDDVIGLALPAVFSYGLTNLMMGLARGATVVLERSAAFPVKLAARWEAQRVTVFPGVPTLFAAMLGLSGLARFELRALRIITNAAAPLPESHVQRLRAAFPAARLISMYGMTECIRASYLAPEDLDRRPGSVGRGIAGQRHWLIDEASARLPCGSVGELVVSGPHVMAGYWQRPAETAAKFVPGAAPGERAMRTGDIFRSDADGYLYFVSRKDDIIKTRGEKVAPREVENVICELDDVAACAVIGIADEALGETVKAYVVLRPGAALVPREVVKHCLARLEAYMAPRSVEIVEALPRTESGKVRHASLRERPSGR